MACAHLFSSSLALLHMSRSRRPSEIEFITNDHDFLTITSYLEFLKFVYRTQAEMRSTQVVSVQLLKKRGLLAEHEYIAVRARDSQNVKGYLVYERRCGHAVGTESDGPGPTHPPPSRSVPSETWRHLRKAFTPRLHPSLGDSSSSASVSSASSSRERYALDTVRIQETPRQRVTDQRIVKLRFPEHPPYIYQITILANILHENDTVYKLCSTNCYWFSACLMTLLKKEFDGQLATPAAIPFTQGYWKSLVSTIDRQLLDAVVTNSLHEYKIHLKIFEDQIAAREPASEIAEWKIKETHFLLIVAFAFSLPFCLFLWRIIYH